ncbi:hypothetical protein [Haloparvum sedimenti]|uniref:hypothetical protein n=1 Tax=Haloparvum sedimenti TaxID=1678448 RepID=UPI00071E73BF|nr:hypothetical protein [Haloparvum sedimenti]
MKATLTIEDETVEQTIEYAGPSEPMTYYHSIEIFDNGELLAEVHVSRDAAPDIEDPEDVEELLESALAGVKVAQEMDP